jgi:hypothetical protein
MSSENQTCFVIAPMAKETVTSESVPISPEAHFQEGAG